MNRAEYIFYEASEICDRWTEWFRQQGRDVDWASLLTEIQSQWREDDDLEGGIPALYMHDLKIALLTYPGFWHPDDIVTGHPDDIIWDIAYSMISNYLHEND